MNDRLQKRSHLCGVLRSSDNQQNVSLNGWVHSLRNLGGLIFCDIRDHSGLTQVVFDPQDCADDLMAKAGELKPEYCIGCSGQVRLRDGAARNEAMPTGEIEVLADQLLIYSASPTPPFEINNDQVQPSLEMRMQHRHLDWRRPQVNGRLRFRSQVMQAVRQAFHGMNFVEVETPILFKSTPEGARDYLVPSRLQPGSFYALPQSPQTLKQMLMCAGQDRYFQLARCFRDEDLRGDRQPEFTQIDMEMSFVDEDDVHQAVESCFQRIFQDVMDAELTTPFEKMDYKEALRRYGSDAPDRRFGLEHELLNEVLAKSEFKVFQSVLKQSGELRALCLPKGAELSRKDMDGLTDFVKEYGAGGLVWWKVGDEGLTGPTAKFLSDDEKNNIIDLMKAPTGSAIFVVADQATVAMMAMDKLRRHLGQRFDLIDKTRWDFFWVVNFPLFEATDDGGITYSHHPFCWPEDEDIPLLENDPLAVRARSYDLVLNGVELGSGSIRCHDLKVQKQILDVLGISPEQQAQQFGFLFEGLKYGAPPHGGFAIGFDRVVTLLGGADDIREFIAFPKTLKASDLFSQSPSPVSAQQLRDVHLKLDAASDASA